MVIERALEKLKQAASRPDARMATDATAERRRLLSRPELATPTVQRPVFPQIAIEAGVAESHRILGRAVGQVDDTPASAAYRMLRTRLLHKMYSNRWRTLAITSPGAGEGKSVTALNLALSMARDKSCDVFLLDLDMRNPSMCNYLGARPPREIVSYFAGEIGPADVLFSIGQENLVLAGGTLATQQSSELIANGRLEELLGYIASIAANPIVLLDLPPLLVTDEALLVAPRIDATALVVAEGRTRRDALARARQLLADFSLAGVILNRSTEKFGADSYYGYGYQYADKKN